MKIVLGMDAGTHGIRAVLVDIEGKQIIGEVQEEYTRKKEISGIQEMRAEDLMAAFTSCVAKLGKFLPLGSRIYSIGITHQRGTIIPIDKELKPLAEAVCDSDSRAANVQMLSAYGLSRMTYYRRTGCPFVSFNGLAKILWCKKNRRNLYQKAYAWLSPQDYLLSVLTGKVTETGGSILRNGYYNIHKRHADEELFGTKTPDFMKHFSVDPGIFVGTIKGDWPDYLQGALCIAVSGDQPSALIGAGCIEHSQIAVNLGTTFVASAYSSSPVLDAKGEITIEILPENHFAPEYGTGAGGQFLDWLVSLFYGSDPSAGWKEIDANIARISAGAGGLKVVPLLWQATSPGIFGRFDHFNVTQNRDYFFKAAFEGLAYECRLSIERLLQVISVEKEAVRVFGGLTQMPNFMQLLANVTDRPIEVVTYRQASALGAAFTAAYGADLCPNFWGPEHIQTIGRCYHPDKKEREYYEREFKRYKQER